MTDLEIWEKYGNKEVVFRGIRGIIIAVRNGGRLVFEATDGWDNGHNGTFSDINYGSVPLDSNSNRYFINYREAEIVDEDFIMM